MEVPEKLKPLSSFVKIAHEYKDRDLAIYYWTLYYVAQQAMQLDKDSPESKMFLINVLDTLESAKKVNVQNESLTQEVVAQAHIESHAFKLFNFADQSDRASTFNKNVVKAFYASGHLFDVLSLFGEVDDSVVAARKYAKWKATYIHSCLKKGETPVPGPRSDGQDADLEKAFDQLDPPSKPEPLPRSTPTSPPSNQQNFGWNQPGQQLGQNPFDQTPGVQPAFSGHGQPYGYGQPYGQGHHEQRHQPNPYDHGQSYGQPTSGLGHPAQPPPRPAPSIQSISNITFPDPYSVPNPPPTVKNAHRADPVSLEEYIEARRLCKMASSALDYEDGKTAVDFLEKALAVLKNQPRT